MQEVSIGQYMFHIYIQSGNSSHKTIFIHFIILFCTYVYVQKNEIYFYIHGNWEQTSELAHQCTTVHKWESRARCQVYLRQGLLVYKLKSQNLLASNVILGL